MNPADSRSRTALPADPIWAEFTLLLEGDGITALPAKNKLKDTLRRVPLSSIPTDP